MQYTRIFYLFLGFHSFLIGLFPFFLPLYLVKTGRTLSEVSWFIGGIGLAFCFCLALWDRFCRRFSIQAALVLSFGAELALLLLLTFFEGASSLLPLLAVVNGVYSCLFWMVQRLLF